MSFLAGQSELVFRADEMQVFFWAMGFDRGRVQFFLGRRGRPETPAGVHQNAMRCAGRVDERLAVEAEGHHI